MPSVGQLHLRLPAALAAALAAAALFAGGAFAGAVGLMVVAERRRRQRREEFEGPQAATASALEEDRRAYIDSLLRVSGRLAVLSPDADALRCAVDYDPQGAPAVKSFAVIASRSECIFAKKAVLWGSREPEKTGPEASDYVAAVVRASLRALSLFSACTCIDGFLFELRGRGGTLASLAGAVRECLGAISDADPSGACCMSKSYVDKRGWVFAFAGQEFFVTTFAPCYPPSSPRYAHGATSAFVLLQPYASFLWTGVGQDTPETEWAEPRTPRDRIRVAFARAGRPYTPPSNAAEQPVAHLIVRPLQEGDPPVAWWLPPGEQPPATPPRPGRSPAVAAAFSPSPTLTPPPVGRPPRASPPFPSPSPRGGLRHWSSYLI